MNTYMCSMMITYMIVCAWVHTVMVQSVVVVLVGALPAYSFVGHPGIHTHFVCVHKCYKEIPCLLLYAHASTRPLSGNRKEEERQTGRDKGAHLTT